MSSKVLEPDVISGQRVECYDSGDMSFDRYTAVYIDQRSRGNLYDARAMSEHPFSPQGFGLYVESERGEHVGKRIAFTDLPEDCQKSVKQDCDWMQQYQRIESGEEIRCEGCDRVMTKEEAHDALFHYDRLICEPGCGDSNA